LKRCTQKKAVQAEDVDVAVSEEEEEVEVVEEDGGTRTERDIDHPLTADMMNEGMTPLTALLDFVIEELVLKVMVEMESMKSTIDMVI
jgi:hypothetical protein